MEKVNKIELDQALIKPIEKAMLEVGLGLEFEELYSYSFSKWHLYGHTAKAYGCGILDRSRVFHKLGKKWKEIKKAFVELPPDGFSKELEAAIKTSNEERIKLGEKTLTNADALMLANLK